MVHFSLRLALLTLLALPTSGSYVYEYLLTASPVAPHRGFCVSDNGDVLVYGEGARVYNALAKEQWSSNETAIVGCDWGIDGDLLFATGTAQLCQVWSLNVTTNTVELFTEKVTSGKSCIGMRYVQHQFVVLWEPVDPPLHVILKTKVAHMVRYPCTPTTEMFGYVYMRNPTTGVYEAKTPPADCVSVNDQAVQWNATHVSDMFSDGVYGADVRSVISIKGREEVAAVLETEKITLLNETLGVAEKVKMPSGIQLLTSGQDVFYGLTEKSVVAFRKDADLKALAVLAAVSANPRQAGTTLLFLLPCDLNFLGRKIDIGSDLSRVLHPTKWILFGSEAAGIVIGNAFLCCVLLVVLAAIITAMEMLKMFNGTDVRGHLRYPYGPYFLFHFLYQGTTLGMLELVFHPTASTELTIVGMVGTMLALGVPLLMHGLVSKTVNGKRMVYMEDSTVTDPVKQMLMGKGEWVSTTEDSQVVQRYGSLFRMYKPSCYWFYLMDIFLIVVLGACHKLQPETYDACGHPKIASACIAFIYVMLLAYMQPYNRYQDLLFEISIWTTQAFGLFFLGVHYYTSAPHIELSNARTVSDMLFRVLAYTYFLRMACDLVLNLYVYFTGRVDRVQKQAWKEPSQDGVRCLSTTNMASADTRIEEDTEETFKAQSPDQLL